MMRKPCFGVGVVLLGCADDLCFLERSLPQLLTFADNVVVAFGDKRWDGRPEDVDAIRAFRRGYDNDERVAFATYDPLDASEAQTCALRGMRKRAMMPETIGRVSAYRMLPRSCLYALFLDADEIVDGIAFRKWLCTGTHLKLSAVKFANYWFWRTPLIRARDYVEDSAVMLRRDLIESLGGPGLGYLYDDAARTGYYDRAPSSSRVRCVMGLGGTPMISHYSWCRTRQGMLNKVASWGHRDDFGDRDLAALVVEEYSRPFNGHDFLGRGLSYDVLERDPFDIALERGDI